MHRLFFIYLLFGFYDLGDFSMAKKTVAKNALQEQLLKAGLVDTKKAKKLTKQAQHAKRTGNAADADIKKAVAEAQAEKIKKDQELNQQRQQALEEKTLRANIVQMIQQHQIADTQGEVEYRFVDDSKVKKMNITQKLFDQIVAGHVSIARLEEGYALLPRPLADRINEKLEGFIIESNDKAEDELAEDDPYAAYVIPDDLMW